MKSERQTLRTLLRRKPLKDIKWDFADYRKLIKLDNSFSLSSAHGKIIKDFKENELKFWNQRYRRITQKINVSNKYFYFLRRGRIGVTEWELKLNERSYKSSKKYLIEEYGEEKANDICYRKGKSFRDSEIQRSNSNKFAKKRAENPEKYKGIIPNQIEYWIKRGYSEEEARLKVKERQTTFSLEKCISKYGEVDGTRVWEERQEKWQNSIEQNNDIELINTLKNPCYIRNNETKDDFYKRLAGIGKNIIYDSSDLEKYIKGELKNPKWKYLTKSEFMSKMPFWRNSAISPDSIIDKLKFVFPEKNKIRKNGKYYALNVDEGYLRSSLEIDFYKRLSKLTIQFTIEKFYTGSKMKSDFYLDDYDLHIEIFGFDKCESYIEKMKFKENEYDALILHPKHFDIFFKRIEENGIEGIKSYIRGIV